MSLPSANRRLSLSLGPVSWNPVCAEPGAGGMYSAGCPVTFAKSVEEKHS